MKTWVSVALTCVLSGCGSSSSSDMFDAGVSVDASWIRDANQTDSGRDASAATDASVRPKRGYIFMAHGSVSDAQETFYLPLFLASFGPGVLNTFTEDPANCVEEAREGACYVRRCEGALSRFGDTESAGVFTVSTNAGPLMVLEPAAADPFVYMYPNAKQQPSPETRLYPLRSLLTFVTSGATTPMMTVSEQAPGMLIADPPASWSRSSAVALQLGAFDAEEARLEIQPPGSNLELICKVQPPAQSISVAPALLGMLPGSTATVTLRLVNQRTDTLAGYEVTTIVQEVKSVAANIVD